MTDALTQLTSPLTKARNAGTLRRVACAGAVILGISEVAWVVHLTLNYAGPELAWTLVHLPVVMATLFLTWRLVGGHERKWVDPAHTLHKVIEDVRKGAAPLEELSTIDGPMAPLAQSVQELLREIKLQKRARASLEADVRQEVMHRTDALERVIATLKTKASRDALTGLFNRRMLDEHLPRVLDQCRADGVSLCILMLDVDNFKLLNDTLGHAAGDELLRNIGQLIRSTCREGDLAFRNGGDEFVVLMPGCEEAASEGLSKRLTSLVDQLVKPLRVVVKPGLSIGIICADDLKDVTPKMLLQRADAAMYARKAGRKAARPNVSKSMGGQGGFTTRNAG